MASPIALISFLPITPVTVIDATGAALQRDRTVVVGGERIQSASRGRINSCSASPQ